jgi:tetratricopeptide (TPR) repeat protein
MCFSDPINSLTSENMPCNIELKDPCAGVFLKIHLIELTGSNNLVMSVDTINRLKTNELFETAVLYDGYDELNYTKTASLIFLTLFDREPNFIYNTDDTAYYYIGKYCKQIFKQYGLAIELLSMDIELTNEMHSLAERGYCYYMLRKKKDALDDFKRVLSMNPPEKLKKTIDLKITKLMQGY